MFSIPHMIVLFVVVLVVFGPQKLPELARGLGKLMAEFRKASTDFKSAFEEEMREMERQALQAERKKAAEAAASAAAVESNQASTTPAALPESAGTSSETPAEPLSESHAPEVPVITPVAESVPRSSEEPIENRDDAAAVTSSQEFPHDNQHPS
jgi:sec-independent protein translocase protein TatB